MASSLVPSFRSFSSIYSSSLVSLPPLYHYHLHGFRLPLFYYAITLLKYVIGFLVTLFILLLQFTYCFRVGFVYFKLNIFYFHLRLLLLLLRYVVIDEVNFDNGRVTAICRSLLRLSCLFNCLFSSDLPSISSYLTLSSMSVLHWQSNMLLFVFGRTFSLLPHTGR